MNREGSITGTLLFILFGPIVWALHFLVIYGSHALLCAAGTRLLEQAGTMIVLLQWGGTIVAGIVLAGGILAPFAVRAVLRAFPATSSEADFAIRVMQLLALLSLFGVVFASIALATIPVCEPLR